MLANSRDVEPWWALAYRVELEFSRAYATLGILSPSYEPRTSAHTQQIQQLIATLIEDRYAYVADDSSGDVYFSVKNWPAYGTLTNQRPEDMSASPDPVTRGKLDQRDFALWKGTKPDEPATASWTAPRDRGGPDGTSSAPR